MSFFTSRNFIKDADGFTPPPAGGTLAVKYGGLTFENGAANPAELFTLPEGAVIVGWEVNVTAAFNDTGTDLLDIGDGTTANRFADNLDVASLGQIVTGYDPNELFVVLDVPVTVHATYMGQHAGGVGAATTGAATVAVFYITQ